MSKENSPNESGKPAVDRRSFLRVASAGAAVVASGAATPLMAEKAAKKTTVTAETTVKALFETLTPKQKETVCFDWNHKDDRRGLLRTRVQNNWHITKPTINSEFFTKDQRKMVREIYEGILQPDWHAKVDKQLQDDAGGFGKSQNIAIFGTPGSDKFEFVMTGRHMTLRCDGNTTEHMAFGGPIFYGHAAGAFNEDPNHKGNVYWEQALEANKVYKLLDAKQQKMAQAPKTPAEGVIAFKGAKGKFDGIPVTELSTDQREAMQNVLKKLIEPYRQSDRDEVLACLKAQGGLDKCHLAFYTDRDLGNDSVWDNWRLEGPSFVWHFRGSPHVHVWANISNSADVETNT